MSDATLTREPPPLYEVHKGTVKISGSTVPWKAASCALRYMDEASLPIDFLAIGGNANQQAMKAMSTFCYQVTQKFPTMKVAFVPMMFSTETHNPVTGVNMMKSCTVWRVILLTLEDVPK